jgi:hypothetical protein
MDIIAKFNLAQYDDGTFDDVRESLKALFYRTQSTIAREKEITLEITLLIGMLDRMNAAVNLRIGKREDLAKELGLTPNQYWKRAQAGRVFINFPEFIEMVLEGKTHISHIALLAPKITQANCEIFMKEIPGMSDREVRRLVASVRNDGSRDMIASTMDLKLTLTMEELKFLDRAREVLSMDGHVPADEEVFVKALKDLIDKRDPVKKAERAEIRRSKNEQVPSAPKESSSAPKESERDDGYCNDGQPYPDLLTLLSNFSPSVPKVTRERIPSHVRHKVFLRDGGRCTYEDENGRCEAKLTLQVDHIVPVCHGGDSSLENLRLLCREHNLMEARRIVGDETMDRYRSRGGKVE